MTSFRTNSLTAMIQTASAWFERYYFYFFGWFVRGRLT